MWELAENMPTLLVKQYCNLCIIIEVWVAQASNLHQHWWIILGVNFTCINEYLKNCQYCFQVYLWGNLHVSLMDLEMIHSQCVHVSFNVLWLKGGQHEGNGKKISHSLSLKNPWIHTFLMLGYHSYNLFTP